MGYDFHIIRSDDWTAAVDAPIDYEEWKGHASESGDLVPNGTLSQRNTEVPETVYALVDGPSIHWWRGGLIVSGAEETDISRLVSIARALHARVQGDDGEFYD